MPLTVLVARATESRRRHLRHGSEDAVIGRDLISRADRSRRDGSEDDEGASRRETIVCVIGKQWGEGEW